MPETLRISEPADAVRCLSVNRPERRNALDRATCAALRAALAAAEADPGVRAILLTGTGGCFTSGNDLRDFRDTAETGEESAGLRFLRGLGACAKPVVAAVEGHAVGIGTTLLLHFAVAGAGARVSLLFVALGLSPEGASSYLLPLVAGHMRYVDCHRGSAVIALNLGVGSRISLARSSMGRAYIAVRSERERAAIYEELRALGTLSWPALRDSLDKAVVEHRELGCCTSFGEWQDTVSAIAVGFYPGGGLPPMSVNCGAPTVITDGRFLLEVARPKLIEAVRGLAGVMGA